MPAASAAHPAACALADTVCGITRAVRAPGRPAHTGSLLSAVIEDLIDMNYSAPYSMAGICRRLGEALK
jgi:hypothetical protein